MTSWAVAACSKTVPAPSICPGTLAYSGPTAVNSGVLGLLLNTVTFDASSGAALTIASNALVQSIAENLNLNVNSNSVAVDVAGPGSLATGLHSQRCARRSRTLILAPTILERADYGCRLAAKLDLGSVHRTIYGWSGGNDVARNNLTGCDCQFAGGISGSAE